MKEVQEVHRGSHSSSRVPKAVESIKDFYDPKRQQDQSQPEGPAASQNLPRLDEEEDGGPGVAQRQAERK